MLQMLVKAQKALRMKTLEQKVYHPRLDATATIRTVSEIRMASGVGSVPSWRVVALLHRMKQHRVSSACLDVMYAIVFIRWHSMSLGAAQFPMQL
jgi:hypothetical protein